ncbi:MAG: ribonuclease HI [Bacteroidales bacterium]|nr:ribonuclease HI [Bacteroidales bacterium]MBN2755565.1 ribonuclease HI [Bacteroidales bacterium]
MDNNTENYIVYEMEIVDIEDYTCTIKIKDKDEYTILKYQQKQKKLSFLDNKNIDKKLEENKYQLKKILNNKREDTFFKGFKLKFVIRDNAKTIEFNDLSKIIVLDRREEKYETYVINRTEKEIFKVYTDGCYLEKYGKSSYVAITKNSNQKLNLFYGKTDEKSSSLIELMAVIKALEISKDKEKIRIISDSRYIIKGLTEWIFNWKLNDWHTAQGEKVKNIDYWKKFDLLTIGKYIEFEWVKSHSEHYENSICDYYAKLAAKS